MQHNNETDSTQRLTPQKEQLPNVLNGLKYPKNRPAFFALKFLRMLLNSCSLIEIGAEGFALCSLVALTEDSRRYADEPRFWSRNLCDYLGIKSRSTLCEIRERCVKAGVLHYEKGRKGVACVMWVLWPACWDKLGGGFLDAGQNAVQNLDSIPSESRQQSDSIPSESRTHSSPVPPSHPSTTTKDTAVVVGFEEVENKLLALGLAKARETIQESLSNGTTLLKILEVIEFYSSRPGAWGPGALRRRLTLGNAQALASAQGWPPASPRESELRRQEAVERDRLKMQREAQTSAATKVKDRQLELQFGSMLDRYDPNALTQLVRERKPFLLANLQRYGSGSGLVRPSLLGLMAEVADASR